MSLTATSQRNAVSEGIALGLVICDRDSLPPVTAGQAHDRVGLPR